jgi:hypothetical protein
LALFPDKKSSQFESPPADDGAALDAVETVKKKEVPRPVYVSEKTWEKEEIRT